MAVAPQPRRRFTPAAYDNQIDPVPPIHSGCNQWTPLISCPADFPIELFETAVSQLIHHPEYNSTLILRSDTLAESTSIFPPEVPDIDGFRKLKCIHRRLLPRRPHRDTGLEQYCTLYTSRAAKDIDGPSDTLVLTPIMSPEGPVLPYYHPKVSHLMFRFISAPGAPPYLRIEVLPLPGTPTDTDSRLYRTCLALLETLYRYGWGALTLYKKRIVHDCLVPREEYQDVYLVMRERYKHLIDTWQEVTDPLKHVFEDIAIATYLMLFWKATYHSTDAQDLTADPNRPWTSWPRPPGGFLDFGCGNGLLTHILTNEGYRGTGIDVRARASWAQYPNTTQAQLHVHAFDPTSVEPSPFLPPGIFIIGNHADELTPWVPVVATISKASGYLSIPCCAWSFDGKFERSSTSMFPVTQKFSTESKVHPETKLDVNFIESLNLGGDGTHTSSYSIYRIWLSTLSLHCGWEVECENLRIPSTRNWAIAGRRRLSGMAEEEAVANARAIVNKVQSRGVFKTRKPEGKGEDH